MVKIDTSEIEFYESTSEPFKKLVGNLGLSAIETESAGVCSSRGKHYLYINKKRVEHIEVLVHEFTELVIKEVIREITDNVVKEIIDQSVIMAFIFLKNETIKTQFIPTNRNIVIEHELSRKSEGDGMW